ncbi:hypothetical protein ACFPC0_11215, partial [Streptomyces andamanensis]
AHVSLDQDSRPEAWWRPEFSEPPRARDARELLASWLLDAPDAMRHIMHLLHLHARPGGRAAGVFDLCGPAEERAIHVIAHWLDDVLYGSGKGTFGLEERYAVQLTADSMARADFCRMDFRALVASVLETGVEPAPLGRPGNIV